MRILFKSLICFLIAFIFTLVFMNECYSYNLDFFKRFNDRYLDEYIEKALFNNHELKQVNYKLEQYRANIQSQMANEFPNASIGSNYLGTHFPKNDYNFFVRQNSYIVPLQASYEPDLLLKNRDKTKSVQKLYKAQCANRDGVYIALLSDVASSYINILLMDYLIRKQLEILTNKASSLSFNNKKYINGVIDTIELNNYINDLDSQRVIYENLIKNKESNLYNLSVLIGESAYNSKELKYGKLEDFEYQETIPDIINSDLIYLRPDIIEIENKLRSARIDVTVAKKEFFPSFNITGLLAFDTAGPGNFFSWNSSFALLAAGFTQDIFKGGAKIANLKTKKARYRELFEEYKQKDLNAIKEINDALNSIKQDKKQEQISKSQLEIERRNFISTDKKLRRGVVSKIDYFDSKTKFNQKEQLNASAKTLRLIDYLSLYKAVGGEL